MNKVYLGWYDIDDNIVIFARATEAQAKHFVFFVEQFLDEEGCTIVKEAQKANNLKIGKTFIEVPEDKAPHDVAHDEAMMAAYRAAEEECQEIFD